MKRRKIVVEIFEDSTGVNHTTFTVWQGYNLLAAQAVYKRVSTWLTPFDVIIRYSYL